MTTQAIFKGLGPNWKWASRDGNGVAKVHTAEPFRSRTQPGIIYQTQIGNYPAFNCPAFDASDLAPDPMGNAEVWKRTNFKNGPDRDTDGFGAIGELAVPPLPKGCDTPVGTKCNVVDCNELVATNGFWCADHAPTPAPSMPVAPPPPPAPTQTRLTTDEAENGMLWAFARSYEEYVNVQLDGSVVFGTVNAASMGRLASDVVVDGVVHPIERTRRVPDVPHPVPSIPHAPSQPTPVEEHTALLQAEVIKHANWGHNPEGYSEYDKGIANGLELAIALLNKRSPNFAHTPMQHEPEPAVRKAKAHAKHLMRQANVDGSEQLTAVQYMAIFGELPE
jgi:hypothetical protein